jgi:hypothetical protein
VADPIIIMGDPQGVHNADLDKAAERLRTGKQYKDLSTICVIPTRGVIPAAVVESWLGLQSPMNNKFLRMFISGMEVGEAYQLAIETILGNEELSKWKYLLTLEEDNLPPPDGLLKLYENICDCETLCKEHYAQVAGLYWTKGEGGQPMIYGNPKEMLAFNPQIPIPNEVQECNGTGMGFTLFHMGLFRDKAIEQPWFKTVQGNEGMGTQDLYAMGKFRRAGYRIASDNRVRVGHWSQEELRAW